MRVDPSAAWDVTNALAQARLADLPALTDRLLAAIFANPTWTDYGPVPEEDLRDGCRRYLTRVLEILGGELEGMDDDEVAAEIGRHRAEQGVPLEAMLRTFRLGGRIVWDALVEQAHEVRADPDVVLGAATSLWAVIDGLSASLTSSYRATELEHLRRDDQRRHALVEDLLAGRAANAGFAQRISNELDLPVAGSYVVVVAEVGVDGGFALSGPERALRSARFRSIWQARSDSLVGLILAEEHELPRALGRLRPLVVGRVGVSPVVPGLARISAAHQFALTALGTVPSDRHELVALDERCPEALLVRSPDLTERLLTAQLGPVLALPAKERDMLLETLTVWLDENCSAANAAVRLHCHRNTVLNRLHRFTSLTGWTQNGRAAYVALSLALSAVSLPETRIE